MPFPMLVTVSPLNLSGLHDNDLLELRYSYWITIVPDSQSKVRKFENLKKKNIRLIEIEFFL